MFVARTWDAHVRNSDSRSESHVMWVIFGVIAWKLLWLLEPFDDIVVVVEVGQVVTVVLLFV